MYEQEAAEAPKEAAVAKKAARSKDDLYLMGVSDQNMTYLDGSLPGDFGFDPLGMSDPEGAGGFVNPQWLAYSEVRRDGSTTTQRAVTITRRHHRSFLARPYARFPSAGRQPHL